MNSAELLSGFERCARIAWWGHSPTDEDLSVGTPGHGHPSDQSPVASSKSAGWKPRKMKPAEMVEAGVEAAMLEAQRSDLGQLAGETVYGLGSDPGIDSKLYDQHSEVVHLAALADVIASAIRRPGAEPWKRAADLPGWRSGCFLAPDGTHLRRIVYVTSWNDDRHYTTCRSWEALGEVCAHGLPMHLVVAILGAHRQGKFYSWWTHGVRHPANKKLRFRKKLHVDEPFKSSWSEIWREDFDDLSTEDWLNGMLGDDVLGDVLKRIDIEVPKTEHRQRIVDLARRKLEIIGNTRELPMQNLSTCDWPVPCMFRSPCHAQQEPSEKYGFMQITRR